MNCVSRHPHASAITTVTLLFHNAALTTGSRFAVKDQHGSGSLVAIQTSHWRAGSLMGVTLSLTVAAFAFLVGFDRERAGRRTTGWGQSESRPVSRNYSGSWITGDSGRQQMP